MASQIVKMNGTAICVDSDEVKGQTYVKALNDSAQSVRAYFYACDFHAENEVLQVLGEIVKQHQELSVVINASEYSSLIATYFAVSLKWRRLQEWPLIDFFSFTGFQPRVDSHAEVRQRQAGVCSHT